MDKFNGLFIPSFILCVCCVHLSNGGLAEFMKDGVYSILSVKNNGALTRNKTIQPGYDTVITKPWEGSISQQWIVEDYQSLGRYELIQIPRNDTTLNPITHKQTRNVYSNRMQWRLIFRFNGKLQIQNPESGLCLTSIKMFKQPEERKCDPSLSSDQLWRFSMVL